MNDYLELNGSELWHIAGWTMLHFLWLGAVVGIAAAICRLALRSVSAQVRYAVAIVSLVILTVLPVLIFGWLAAKPQAIRIPHEIGNAAAPVAVGNDGAKPQAIDPSVAAAVVGNEIDASPPSAH